MKLLTIIFMLSALLIITPAQASSLGNIVNQEFDVVQEDVTGSSIAMDLDNIVISIIQTALSLLGLIFVVLIIWSGYQWMTAGGNSEAIGTAKKRIINAVIGLIIVLAAYSITHFVITRVYDATSRESGSCSSDSECPDGWSCEEIPPGSGEKKCVF